MQQFENNYNSNYILNFGPQHPAAHGVLRLILELDGEIIISADPHIGFLHRGTEKLMESKTYSQSLPYFDRLDYVSMLSQEHVFVLAVEILTNTPLSIEYQIIRVLMDEITRILNHIMCITTNALDVGALTPFLWGFEEREYLLAIYELVSGARMHASFYRFGGISFKLPDLFYDRIYEFLFRFNSYINIIDDLMSKNPIWLSRLSGVGKFSKKDSLEYAFTGPVMRSTGIPWDIRKTQPYSMYNSVNFNVPIGVSGDSYSRYYIRLLEMKESLSIINQCIDYLSNLHKYRYRDNHNLSKSIIKQSMEELIYEFKERSDGLRVNKGSIYSSIETPKGEMGIYINSDGESKPYRCHIKSPGFVHLQGINSISSNLLISDLVTNIGSLDIVFGEIDR